MTMLQKHQKLSPAPGLTGLAGVVEARSSAGRRIRHIAAFRYDGRTWSVLAIAAALLLTVVSLTNAQDRGDANGPNWGEENSHANAAILRAQCVNHLKQWGLIMKLYANENRGRFPTLSTDAGYLVPNPNQLFPDYVNDLLLCYCPAYTSRADIEEELSGEAAAREHFQSSDYYYLGYVLEDDASVETFASVYRAAIESGKELPETLEIGIEDGPTTKIHRLREGVERFFITDINNPAAGAQVQSRIPVMMDKMGNHNLPEGGNVIYMDGHVEFVRKGDWPMTERTHAAMASLEALRAPVPNATSHSNVTSHPTYQFAIGDTGHPVDSGILKLYCIGWGFVQEYEVGVIEAGDFTITLTPENLVDALAGHHAAPLTAANLHNFLTLGVNSVVVALSLPDDIWYRTPDQPFQNDSRVLQEDAESLEALLAFYHEELLRMTHRGIAMLPTGSNVVEGDSPIIVLPEQRERTIRLLDSSGNPVAGKMLDVAVYLSTENHCGGHTGFNLGNYTTDANGEIQVRAPNVPLFLERLIYYEPDGSYAGIPVYEGYKGLKIGSEPLEIVQKTWPENFEPSNLRITVIDAEGNPMPDVTVHVRRRLQVCGAISGQKGRSDEDGVIHLNLESHLAPPIVKLVELWRYEENDTGLPIDTDISRPLLEEELEELFAHGHTVITWDAPFRE